MTVSTAYSPLSFAGNSATTAFAVSWPFLTGTLVVTEISSTGVETVKTITTHYTVTGGTTSEGLPSTGTVTMLTAPATGTTLRITRVTPKTNATTWSENDGFPQKVVEAAFDKLVLIAQENAHAASDVLRLDLAGTDWDAAGKRIKAVGEPNSDDDAVTRGYLNSRIGISYADDAAASAAAAEAALDAFTDLYLGSKTADPTVDNDGGALQEGSFYWNSVGKQLKFYNGSGWSAYSPASGVSSVNSRTGSITLSSSDLTMAATSRIVARKSSGGGASEEATLSEILDFIGSAAHGDILYRGASSWARLGAGTAGHVLTSGGAGANPSYQESVSGMPSGTVMLFVQTAAPTGWTKSTTHNDKALRVVSGTASSGGSTGFTAAMVNAFNSGSTTLTTAQIPAHTHSGVTPESNTATGADPGGTGTATGSAGGGGSHNHTVQLNVAYVDVIIATRD